MESKQLLNLQKQLLPDLLEVMQKRYRLLRDIQLMQPIGRRSLASAVNMTERVLRSEVTFLKNQGLIQIESIGMRLTAEGAQLIEKMEPLVKEIFGLSELQRRLAAIYRLREVTIVPGNADESEVVKKALGREGAKMLSRYAQPGDVIAVNGGTTVAVVAEMLTPSSALKEAIFVPGRGGLGESVELQANFLASKIAKKTGASYRLIHVPEHMSETAYRSLVNEPQIGEVLEVIRSARIVLHGIGDAMAMARRRQVSPEVIQTLENSQAVGEAFGYYFDRDGNVVYRMNTVGLHLEDVHQAEIVLAVAGGMSKAEAIASVCRGGIGDVLVTDEAAAEAMLKLHEQSMTEEEQ